MIDAQDRSLFSEDHHAFRDTVRKVLDTVVAPRMDVHEADGVVERDAWAKVGAAGLLCPQVPEAYGGLGLDFGYNAIVDEELSYLGSAAGFTLQSDIVADYIVHYGSEEQKKHWLPEDGRRRRTITAIAMTEPGTGSDLQGMTRPRAATAITTSSTGSKTYITNGQNADLILVCVKTDTEVQPACKGISIVPGRGRSRRLHARPQPRQDRAGRADTSELFFDDVRVPDRPTAWAKRARASSI